MAGLHVKSPQKLLGKTVAVYQSTEMHVFLLRAMDEFALPYREVRWNRGASRPPYVAIKFILCTSSAAVTAGPRVEFRRHTRRIDQCGGVVMIPNEKLQYYA